jgi:hypothetical protein
MNVGWRILETPELEEWALQLTGEKIQVGYNWKASPLNCVAVANHVRKWICMNGQYVVNFRPQIIKQKAYFLHELGHIFNNSKNVGAREFGAQFWAIKKCHHTGLERLNEYSTYILRAWGQEKTRHLKDEKGDYADDGRYFMAFKIGKKLKVI